jgi:hypothetical protein
MQSWHIHEYENPKLRASTFACWTLNLLMWTCVPSKQTYHGKTCIFHGASVVPKLEGIQALVVGV